MAAKFADCPVGRRTKDVPLAEQARNRDHDSSDECEQARKQHNLTQEHTHTRASPSLLCAGNIGSKAVPAACRASPPAIWPFIDRGMIDYALYLNSGISQALTNSADFFRA